MSNQKSNDKVQLADERADHLIGFVNITQTKAQEPPLKRSKPGHKPILEAPSILILSNAAQPDLVRRFVAAVGSTTAISQLNDLCYQVRQQTLSAPMTMPNETYDIVRNLQVLDCQKLATAIVQKFHLRMLVPNGRKLQPKSLCLSLY